MRCLFCRADSSESKSEEHIIPHSLGNRTHILKPGVVCDSCNNYFSREVERPFLESQAIKTLRFHQFLENRRGRIPTIPGLMGPDIPIIAKRDFKTGSMLIDVPTEHFDRAARMERSTIFLPMAGSRPSDLAISRFMAKVALEAMAWKINQHPEGLDYFCDEQQLNPIRDHARRGTRASWPVHTRRIYSANSKNSDGGQTINEFDFLVTELNEWFFVLALFGLELAINLGGPDIEGYVRWLKKTEMSAHCIPGRTLSIQYRPIHLSRNRLAIAPHARLCSYASG